VRGNSASSDRRRLWGGRTRGSPASSPRFAASAGVRSTPSHPGITPGANPSALKATGCDSRQVAAGATLSLWVFFQKMGKKRKKKSQREAETERRGSMQRRCTGRGSRCLEEEERRVTDPEMKDAALA